MKQKATLWMLSAILMTSSVMTLIGCKHDMDDYTKKHYSVTDEERVKYAEKTLGITIDPEQDWSLTRQYSVEITADADLEGISEVAVLEGNPYAGIAYRMARTAATKNAKVKLSFRAPSAVDVPNDWDGSTKYLYAACLTKDGQCIARPFVPGEDLSVSLSDSFAPDEDLSESRSDNRSMRLQARSLSDVHVIDPSQKGAGRYKQIEVRDYYTFLNAVLNNLPKGKDNRDKFADSYDSRVKVKDNPYHINNLPLAFIYGSGNENDNLFYNWYPGGQTADKESFLIKDDYKNSFVPTYREATKGYLLKGSYLCKLSNGTLNNQFSVGDVLTFHVANGEEPLSDVPDERVKVFLLNGYLFAAFEDGNDWDYNDRLFWLPNGILNVEKTDSPFDPIPPVSQVWTYAWEDKDFGDYDMNDCVIEVRENAEDPTKLDVTLVALGATRELWLGFENKDAQTYSDYIPVFQDELHNVLRVPIGTIVNTGVTKANPVTVTVSKPAGFDFQTCSFVLGARVKEDQQGIYDSDYYAIGIATKGQDPHGIVIPGKWQWPTERTCITEAYKKFAIWAHDISSKDAWDWYMYPVSGKVVTDK